MLAAAATYAVYIWVGIAVGAIAIIGASWRAVGRIGKGLEQHVTEAVMPAVRDEIAAQLAPLRKELCPNGGTSLKDQMVRLDAWRPTVNEHLKRQDRAIEKLGERIDNIKDR